MMRSTGTKQRLEPLDRLHTPDQWREIRDRTPSPYLDIRPVATGTGRGLAIAAVALLVAVAGIAFAYRAFQSSDGPTPATHGMSDWKRRTLHNAGIVVDVPRRWRSRHLITMVDSQGLVASNVRLGRAVRMFGDLQIRRLPRHSVVVEVWGNYFCRMYGPGDYGCGASQSQSDFPLRLADASRAKPDPHLPSGWRKRTLSFAVPGVEGSVYVWFGPDASAEDRRLAARVVRSIRPWDEVLASGSASAR